MYTHDGASAKFSTNSHETDYSVLYMNTIIWLGAAAADEHHALHPTEQLTLTQSGSWLVDTIF
jgi:hypothetical protein